MTPTEAFALSATACVAGAINAIAGGGTLLTFPALLFFGTAPIVANATSTLALVFGTAGSIFGYRRQLVAVKPWLRRFIPVSVLGGWLGGVLLTRTSNETFSKLVPYLILFATVLFLVQGTFRRLAAAEAEATETTSREYGLWMAIAFQFAVAVYGGYFGAGIGILMLASLGFLGLMDIHQMNGLKSTLGSLINLVAAVWFVISGLIDWPRMWVMTMGAVIGYFLGAHFSQRIPQNRVRQIITGVGFAISAAMFYKELSH